jgi:hypothetical protein
MFPGSEERYTIKLVLGYLSDTMVIEGDFLMISCLADPYSWLRLPYAKVPFSEETIAHLLPYFDNTEFVRELCAGLRAIFEVALRNARFGWRFAERWRIQ